MKKVLYLGILCTLLLSACNDDDKEEITPSRDIQMLVVNEGINGEGGLSVVYGDGTIDVNAYEKANERILQGSPYAINSINDKYFLTASAPARIEVLDPTTLAVLGTIEYEKIGMPRDIIPISESEAIVADSIHQLTKINTVTNSIVKHMTLAEEWGFRQVRQVFCSARPIKSKPTIRRSRRMRRMRSCLERSKRQWRNKYKYVYKKCREPKLCVLD